MNEVVEMVSDEKKLEANLIMSVYAYENDPPEKIPPPRKQPGCSGMDPNLHGEIMTCGNCAFFELSRRYKDLCYCGMANAIGVKQKVCRVDPSCPGCDWWMSRIPCTEKELDRLHLIACGIPRNHGDY